MTESQGKDANVASDKRAAGPNLPGLQPESPQSASGAPKIEVTSQGEKATRKKRYYNPGEVMKKKGCIGCGGMALAILLLAAGILAAVAAL